jgi:hypothetical protein
LVELRRVPIPIEEEDVSWIDRADRRLEPFVERADGGAVSIGGLVDRVVTRDPWVVLVVRGDMLPQVHDAVLELALAPEVRPLRRVVTVPVLVLCPGNRMQIEDRVDPVSCTRVDDGVEQPEALLLDHERRVVIFEMPIVERNAERVHADAREERGILVGEEGGQETVEEPRVPLFAENTTEGPALLRFGAGVPRDEVLHVHPPPESETAQHDGRLPRHDARSHDLQDRRLRHTSSLLMQA